MKTLVKELHITYRWWRMDKKATKKSHVESLDDRAMEIIQRKMRDGCTSGELMDEDGTGEYRGYWKVFERK